MTRVSYRARSSPRPESRWRQSFKDWLEPWLRGEAKFGQAELGGLGGTRTPDALLRTEALYPLSYEAALEPDCSTQRRLGPSLPDGWTGSERDTRSLQRTPGQDILTSG